jgi:hypothetical protein
MANWIVYDNARLKQHNGNGVNFSTSGSAVKVMLVTAGYTPSQSTHANKSDLSSEVTGTNYTARGAALASKTLTLASGVVTFDAADLTWLQNAAGFSNARYAVMYVDTGTDATSQLISYADLGASVGNVSGDLVLQWDAAGLLTSP